MCVCFEGERQAGRQGPPRPNALAACCHPRALPPGPLHNPHPPPPPPRLDSLAAVTELLRCIIAVYRELFKSPALTAAALLSNIGLTALVVDEACREVGGAWQGVLSVVVSLLLLVVVLLLLLLQRLCCCCAAWWPPVALACCAPAHPALAPVLHLPPAACLPCREWWSSRTG